MIRQRNIVSFYSAPEKVEKRSRFFREKTRLKECGVMFAQDKPWYCGEMDWCCDLCKSCYKLNTMNKRF